WLMNTRGAWVDLADDVADDVSGAAGDEPGAGVTAGGGVSAGTVGASTGGVAVEATSGETLSAAISDATTSPPGPCGAAVRSVSRATRGRGAKVSGTSSTGRQTNSPMTNAGASCI